MADVALYPSHEAIAILVDKANTLNPNAFREERRTAAARLLREFRTLVTDGPLKYAYYLGAEVGAFLGEAWGFGIPHKGGVVITIEPEGDFTFWRHNKAEKRWYQVETLRLPYDPATQSLTGDTVDTTIAPKPGEPLPRRSGLAAFVEAALRLVEQDIQETK